MKMKVIENVSGEDDDEDDDAKHEKQVDKADISAVLFRVQAVTDFPCQNFPQNAKINQGCPHLVKSLSN